jgi:hypothetical protein
LDRGPLGAAARQFEEELDSPWIFFLFIGGFFGSEEFLMLALDYAIDAAINEPTDDPTQDPGRHEDEQYFCCRNKGIGEFSDRLALGEIEDELAQKSGVGSARVG